MRDHVIYESRLELSRLVLADFDSDVRRIVAQPFMVTATVGGCARRHIPDYLWDTDSYVLLDIIEIADDLEIWAEEVADLYHYVSDQFGVDHLLTRVSLLPRRTYWDRLARTALREELYAVLSKLTHTVASRWVDTSSDRDVRGVFEEWQANTPMRDIRELADQPEAYAAELSQRWGGLLSYRYIGRRFGVIDVGQIEETVTIRRDMRNPAGGLLVAVFGIASPERGNITDLEAVPNPVVNSCQVLDAGRDVSRIEIFSERIKRGRQMAYSRSVIVDADQRDRVLALTEGQGISIGFRPTACRRWLLKPSS